MTQRILRKVFPVVLVLAVAFAVVGVNVRLAPTAHAGGTQDCFAISWTTTPYASGNRTTTYGFQVTNDCGFTVYNFQISDGADFQDCSVQSPDTYHWGFTPPSFGNNSWINAGDTVSFGPATTTFECMFCIHAPLGGYYHTWPSVKARDKIYAQGQGNNLQIRSNGPQSVTQINNDAGSDHSCP